MEFEPLYLSDRIHCVDFANPQYQKNKLNIINPRGNVGIVTLWTPPERVWEDLLERFPKLFSPDSPLVTLTSLYGNGIPQMLANLAFNPQIDTLAITGTDTKIVPSSDYLLGFLRGELDLCRTGDVPTYFVRGTNFSIDAQLKPEMFSHLRVERFEPSALENAVNFILGKEPLRKNVRIEIKLREPKFNDFPSDLTNHNIVAETPLEAWMEVMYRINRFGQTVVLSAKGTRRSLFNLDVNIRNPAVDVEKATGFGFFVSTSEDYQRQILSGELVGDSNYSYGHRLRKYWGDDTLQVVGEAIRKDKSDRYQHVSLWHTLHDLIEGESHPCLTDIYFMIHQDKLMLTAGFRTHNAVSAYLYNLYALRAVQEEVAKFADVAPGQINVRSRYISIDPSEPTFDAKMKKIEERRRRKVNVNDPIGYFVINPTDGKIGAEHYSPSGQLLKRYVGTATEIKNSLRHDVAVLDADHAMWIGHELARAEFELKGQVSEM